MDFWATNVWRSSGAQQVLPLHFAPRERRNLQTAESINIRSLWDRRTLCIRSLWLGVPQCSQTGPALQFFGIPGSLHFDLRSGVINLTEIVGGEFH